MDNTAYEIVDGEDWGDGSLRIRERHVNGSRGIFVYDTVHGDSEFEDAFNLWDDAKDTFASPTAFFDVDFSDEHLKAVLGNYYQFSFSGVWFNCQNIEVSPYMYGSITRAIGVNNAGAIFIGCATFPTFWEAKRAIEFKYNCDLPLGRDYLEGLRQTYEAAEKRFGFVGVYDAD